MTGFNDGIEAAYREALNCVDESTEPISGAEAWMARHIADRIAALKRPEPSEEERVEKVAAVIERELMVDEMPLADPTTLRKIKSQRIARAVLKAMEGERCVTIWPT